jgi:hypothetical protein
MTLSVAETKYSAIDRKAIGEDRTRYDVQGNNKFMTTAFKLPAFCSFIYGFFAFPAKDITAKYLPDYSKISVRPTRFKQQSTNTTPRTAKYS